MSIIFSEMYVKTDIGVNSNKFWSISCDNAAIVQVTNGRVGGKGQVQKPKGFGDQNKAMRYVQSKIREKTRDGYVKFEAAEVAPQGSAKVVSPMELELAASNQIRTTDKTQIADLISRLVKANLHNILQVTDLQYDDTTGVFKTPLGVVTQSSIEEGRKLLGRIAKHMLGGDFTSDEMNKLVASYLMLIPQKVGRKLVVRDLFPNQDSLDKQAGILDDLESSIIQLEALRKQKAHEGTAKPLPKIFNCEVDVVSDQAVIDRIDKFYRSTSKRMHTSYGLKIKRVYAIKIDSMEGGFETGKQKGNIVELWHGTRPSNVLSILKSGLVIPRASSWHTNGAAFGQGCYFSDISTKSLQYSNGYHAGTRERQVFMFLCEVALGTPFMAQRSDSKLHKKGYDSVFAKGGQAGILNNEFIVYSPDQARPRFLVEFCDG